MRVARGIDADMGDPELTGYRQKSSLGLSCVPTCIAIAPSAVFYSIAGREGEALPSARAAVRGRKMDGAAFSDLGSPRPQADM